MNQSLTRTITKLRRAGISTFLRLLSLWNSLLRKLGSREVYYAEYFTDRYLRKTFFPDFNYKGVLVEVGCATPELISMSQHFRINGWRCVGIEPNPKFVALHRAVGNEVYQYAAADFELDDYPFQVVEASDRYGDLDLSAHSYSSLAIKPEFAEYDSSAIKALKTSSILVSVRKLDTILSTNCPDITSIDLLTVDVEGYELEVMKGFDLDRYSTKVVVLENLFHAPVYTEYMKERGYRLHRAVKYNYIYLRESDPSGV